MVALRTPPPSRLPALEGITQAAAAAGIRYRGRDDAALVLLPEGTRMGGALTRSSMPGAPVARCRGLMRRGRARALLVTAGIANVHAGPAGAATDEAWAGAVARRVGCDPRDVWTSATGIIGRAPPRGALAKALPALAAGQGPRNWPAFARAIGTTDTVPKAEWREARIDGERVRVAGVCKGSGMIAPDMATTLCFLFTDAALEPRAIRNLVRGGLERSFHAIDIDGQPSTSDMVLLAASGRRRHGPARDGSERRLAGFRRALWETMEALALAVVGDAEGARRLITLEVSGAADDRSARRVARALAGSPLVRTAFASGETNWGRIVAVVGGVERRARPDELEIAFGGHLLARGGGPAPGAAAAERRAAAALASGRLTVSVRVGRGPGRARLHTSDMTPEYMRINADYAT